MSLISLSAPATVRRRGVVAFLLICFSWTWLSLVAGRAAGLSASSVTGQLLMVAFVPAGAAVVIRLWITREGFRDSGLRPRLRACWRHYAMALAIPSLVFVLGLLLARVLGLWSPGDGFNAWTVISRILLGALVAIPGSLLLFGEEFGWTAYLRDRLLPGRPVATTFLTGCIWAVWHFPLPWAGYFGQETTGSEALVQALLWVPICILAEFLIGWLWVATGSVWSGALLHSGINLIAGVGLHAVFAGQVPDAVASLLMCAGMAPFVVAVIASGHLAEPRPRTGP